jgi:hypothetical protein
MTDSALRIRKTACFLAFLAVTLFVHRGTLAQTISGQVVDSVTGLPVGAGFVVLLTGDGSEVARSLTATSGRFTFSLPDRDRGPYRVRSERIGYLPAVSDLISQAGRVRSDYTLRVTPLPRILSTIEVRGRTECVVRPPEASAAALVWEEARKALAAATWTESERAFHVISTVFERDLDRRGRRVTDERHGFRAGYATNPFVSQDPDQLLRAGYVIVEDDAIRYYAPDAHTLQDPGFLDTHCFHPRLPDEEDSDLIGLAFEPAPGRDLPDVEGTVWLDRETAHLKSIEFRYTNVPRGLPSSAEAGGTVELLGLPSGAWIVSRWSIRVPTGWRSERANPFDRFESRTVEALRETGGEVLTVRDEAGVLVHEVDMAELLGRAVDTRTNDSSPLAGAEVRIVGTWFADTTDAIGRFVLRAPITGDYGLTFSHPSVDWMAFMPATPVSLLRGRRDTIDLALPTNARVLAALCSERAGADTKRVLVGIVRDGTTGRPIAGATVGAYWQEVSANLEFRDLESTVVTDAGGGYTLCGLPVERPVVLYASAVHRRSEIMRVEFEHDGVTVGNELFDVTTPAVWQVDLPVRSRSMLTASVTGIVTDALTGSGVAEAIVRVGDSIILRTDRLGAFEADELEAGSYNTTVTRPGYRSRRAEITLKRGATLVLGADVLALAPEAHAVGSIIATDTDKPVANAQVRLIRDDGTPAVLARADSSGRYVISAPHEGSYYVEAAGIGLGPGRAGPVALRPGYAVDLDVLLSPGAYDLDPIDVTAEAMDGYLRAVGFYERQRSSRGYHLTRANIEQRLGAASDGAHLISQLPGVSITDGTPGSFGAALRISRACGGPPLIFVDGFRILTGLLGEGGGQPSYNFLTYVVQPEDVHAIEVYRSPSQIPPQFGGSESMCGVIVIWTSRGIRDAR